MCVSHRSVLICGGFAPAVATLLVDRFSNASPGYILTALSVVSWLGLYIAPDLGNNRNDQEGAYGKAPQLQAAGEIEIT